MLPLGLAIQRRRSVSSIRTIYLTSPGISTNLVLNSLIPDIIKGSADGFKCHDDKGQKVQVSKRSVASLLTTLRLQTL